MFVTVATAVIALSGTISCVPAEGATPRVTAPGYRSLYEQGVRYIEFRNAAKRRVEAWHDHYAKATVANAIVAKLEAIPGKWRLLVVAEDWCGDSANTIPYVAKLVDLADNLDLRIIRSDDGKEIMETHRTPDGRAATPTVILLNERFEEAGCFVERPSGLQEWFLEHEAKLDEDDLYDQKYAWYAEDAGRATVDQIVAMVEAAADGSTICG